MLTVNLSAALAAYYFNHRSATEQEARSPPLDAALVGVRLISLDDHLHQLMAHHVFFVEVNKFNPFYIGQHAFSLDQATSFSGWQVNLRYVAGDNGLGAKTDSREEHFHLLARRVLGLIQDDERIGQRATTHKGQGRYFYDAFLQEACDALVVDQIKKRV